jgi:fimbrial chaperone protein
VACLAALPFLLFTGLVEAASFHVAPVRLTFEAQQRSDAVTLTNSGAEPVSVQADAVVWSQDEAGGDRYEATSDLLVVPRIFTIPPGEAQVVRIGRLIAADPVRQGAYRIFFSELAPPSEPGSSTGLRFRLRLGIPVFMAPAQPAEPKVSLVRSQQTSDGLELVLNNPGDTHVQLLTFKSGRRIGRGAHEIEHTLGAYLLPGTTRRFVVPVPPDIRIDSFAVATDVAGTMEYAARPPN